jgi:c-di-GMP-binding flagellar brake protein YcgR
MECQRRFTRAEGHSASCILVRADGDSCRAKLENISIGGALIRMNEGASHDVHVGDECTVTLCNCSGLLASEYSCRVVWRNLENLGIQFITQ